jgi:hypothetical protein
MIGAQALRRLVCNATCFPYFNFLQKAHTNMIKPISIAITLTLFAQAAVAQTVARPRAMVTATPKATQFSIQPLTPAEMRARLRPAPRYLAPAELNLLTPFANAVLNAPFSLTPAVQAIAGRGFLNIGGKVFVPNPAPPNFPGQATLRYYGYGEGWVHVTLDAKKDKFYAVDCLATVDSGRVNFETDFDWQDNRIESSGVMDPKEGHLIFNVRRTTNDGPIKISFRPDEVDRTASGPGTNVPDSQWLPSEQWKWHVMDFWGCQITPVG